MPKNVKQTRALLGGLSYYRKFVPQFAKRIRPLTSLLKKDVKFEFTPAMEGIVRELLAELANPPVLVYPDWDAVADGSRPFHLYCDASKDGFGGTLEQEQLDGSIRPIVYISRATLISERHWTPLDLEAGSIIWCIKRLRGYLWGTHFHIFTDHKALEHFAKVGENNARVLRWLEFLTAYSYTLEYRKGSANGNADFLSRLPMEATEQDRTGRSRLTPTDEDDAVFSIRHTDPTVDTNTDEFIRSCGLLPQHDHSAGIQLGGLLPVSPDIALGGLPLSSSDFADFRDTGPRVDVSTPGSLPSVWHIRDMPPTVCTDSSPSLVRNRPPLISRDVFAIDGPTTPSTPQARPRPTLNLSEVISTRTRRRSAAAAGTPRPAVNYGFDDQDEPTPTDMPPPELQRSSPSSSRSPTAPAAVVPATMAPTAPVTTTPPVSDVLPETLPAGPLLGSSPLTSAAPESGDSVPSPVELDFRESVDKYSHADWAREQRNEPVCAAAIRYIELGQPSVLPSGFLDHVPSALRPPFSEIRELAQKGRLYVNDDDVVLLVRKPTKPPSTTSSRPGGRAARLLNDEPIRIYVPMLMRPWIMQVCHANVSCHFGAARTLSMLERFYWCIGMSVSTKWWIRHCLR